MSDYSSYSDDFYNTVTLNTEMELPSNRDTVVHFFEQLRKLYPGMKNFYNREDGEYVLEEDKEQGHYRWSAIESKRISSGYVNPPELDQAIEQHMRIFDSAPHLLSASGLDCELLTVMFGFDFTYRGNHNQLLADVIGLPPALEKMSELPGARIVCFEPLVQYAVDEDCRTQLRLSVEPRTSAYHVKTGEYPEEQLSVFLAVRRYGSLESGDTFTSTIDQLISYGRQALESYVIENVLVPLRQNIAIK